MLNFPSKAIPSPIPPDPSQNTELFCKSERNKCHPLPRSTFIKE